MTDPLSSEKRARFKATACWKCSKPYPIKASTCRHCGATNANADLDKAKQEQKIQNANLAAYHGDIDGDFNY